MEQAEEQATQLESGQAHQEAEGAVDIKYEAVHIKTVAAPQHPPRIPGHGIRYHIELQNI